MRILLLVLLLAAGRHTYVVDAVKGSLDVVDGATSKVIRSVPVGPRPTGFAVSPDERRVFVCIGGKSEIVVIDAASFARQKTIQVGSSPQNIYVTPDNTRMIATSGRKLSIINIRTEAVEFEIPLGGSPGTLTIDSDKNLVIQRLLVQESHPDGVEIVDYAGHKVVGRR